MKKRQLLAIILTSLFLFNCNSNDDNNDKTPTKDTNKNSIIGKWELVSITDKGETEQASECGKKSVIEFKNDTFKDIAVRKADNTDNCVYNGFGTSGTFVLNNTTLTRTTIDVIAIPKELNNPKWIEEAKGKNDPETVSFENGMLSLTEKYEEQGNTLITIYTYKKTSNDFFSEK